jgi:hypothetical protein
MDAKRKPADSWTWQKIFAIVVAIWAVIGFGTFLGAWLLSSLTPVINLSGTGQFGDTFGMINSLFSALGVAGVAYALILQVREQRSGRELALLAALIQANSTLLEYWTREHESIDSKLVPGGPYTDVRDMSGLMGERENAIRKRSEYEVVLTSLLHHAKREWNWVLPVPAAPKS